MLKRFLVLSVMLFSFTTIAHAANIAFIDGTAIMKKYEGTIESKLKTEFKGKEENLTKMQKELVDSTETYTRESAMMSNEEKLAFQQNFEKKQLEFQKLSTEFNQQRMKRGNEELEKLLATVKTAAQKIAAEKKYDMVLQSGAALYFDKTLDITQDVLTQLDKK